MTDAASTGEIAVIPHFQVIYIGSQLTMECEGGIVSIWTFNGKIVIPSFTNGNKITVEKAHPQHSGEYKCYAKYLNNLYVAKAEVVVGCKFVYATLYSLCWYFNTICVDLLTQCTNFCTRYVVGAEMFLFLQNRSIPVSQNLYRNIHSEGCSYRSSYRRLENFISSP